MSSTDNDGNLFHIGAICRRLPFTTPDPIDPGNYCEELSGDWNEVPAWAIRRINFLEETLAFNDRARCPKGHEDCPATVKSCDLLSCQAVKHCYSHICDGSCGHNEIWVSDDEKAIIMRYRKEQYG